MPNKKWLLLITLGLASLVMAMALSGCVDSTAGYQPPPLTSPPQFAVVTAGFVFDDSEAGTRLPWCSTIYHWKNGITEVIGPDNNLILIAKDAEAKQLPVPEGPAPATHVYQVPSGSRSTSEGKHQEVMTFYSGNDLIVTIVDKPRDFQYVTPSHEVK
jgi:hypothetical protein